MTARDGSILEPHGPVAEIISDLWWLMLVLGVAVFVLVVVLLVAGLFRRQRGEPDGEGDAGKAGTFRGWLVGGGIVLPAILLVVVLTATVVTMRKVPTGATPDALVVDIVGHQWWWEVNYPDSGVTTANEVHMPVGRKVLFRLTSADVIHSFWVPALGGKMDLLPDNTNSLVLEASRPGEHRSYCAEFCGLQHAEMGLIVVAESPDRFQAWIERQRRPALPPTEARAQRGLETFLQAGCPSCHSIEGTSADGTRGPDLTHLATRATIGAGVVTNTRENLASWMSNPHALKEGVKMPNPKLSDRQLEALLVYLETLE